MTSRLITPSLVARETLVWLHLARNTGIPISTPAYGQYAKWDRGTNQWGVWCFPEQRWREQPLDDLVETRIKGLVLTLAYTMPKHLPAAKKKLENPAGVVDSAIESYKDLSARVIFDWIPVANKDQVSASYYEIRDWYNIEIDELERRACALSLRVDVTRWD